MTGRLAIVAMIAAASSARADVPRDAPTEIEVDRADTPPGRTEFGFDGGAPLDGWGVTLSAGWLEKPLSFTLPDGTVIDPVHRRETFTLGAALALGPTVVVDARFGFAHQIGDRVRGTGDDRALDRAVQGDLRIGGRARVHAGDTVSVLLRGDLAIPTGDQGDFAGDAGTSVAVRLIGRAVLPGGVVVAATGGLRLRGTEVLVGDRLVGNEGLAAAGIAIPIPPIHPLWCVREQVQLTGEVTAIIGDSVGSGRGPSPVEARLGLVTQPLRHWTFGVRVGTGLTDEIGSPRLRATVELTYRGSFQLIEVGGASDDHETDDEL